MWFCAVFLLCFSNGILSHRIEKRQNFDTFQEIVRQKTRGNQISQCPCVLHPQSNQCITYDSRYLAVSFEEAILSFLDLSNHKYPVGIVNSNTFKCETAECQQCFAILYYKLLDIGLFDATHQFNTNILGRSNINPKLCRRFTFPSPPKAARTPSSVPFYVSSMITAGENYRTRSTTGRGQNNIRGRVLQNRERSLQQRGPPRSNNQNGNVLNNNQNSIPRGQQSNGQGRQDGQMFQQNNVNNDVTRTGIAASRTGTGQFVPDNANNFVGQNGISAQPGWASNVAGMTGNAFTGGFAGGQAVPGAPYIPFVPNGIGGIGGAAGVPNGLGGIGAGLGPVSNIVGGFGGGGGGPLNRFTGGGGIPGLGGFGRRKRAAVDLIGRRFTLGCVNKGDSDDEHISLCGTCWTWRQLPAGYFPRLINELSCKENDYCLSGWGECSQQYRNVDVLRKEGEKWVPTVITTATCCDCKVRAGTEIHSLVIGQKK